MERQIIYDIMNGYYEADETFLCGDMQVENEFENGKECAELYEKVYQARLRLADKLGMDEDEDVEALVNGMSDIAKVLAFKMYEYGKLSRQV